MACFICPVFGERRCDGSCGLGCMDCPALSFDERVEALQKRIDAGKASSDDVGLIDQVIDRASCSL